MGKDRCKNFMLTPHLPICLDKRYKAFALDLKTLPFSINQTDVILALDNKEKMLSCPLYFPIAGNEIRFL